MNPTVIDALDKIGWPEWREQDGARLRVHPHNLYGYVIEQDLYGWRYVFRGCATDALIETHLREWLARSDLLISFVPVQHSKAWEACRFDGEYLDRNIDGHWGWTGESAFDFPTYIEAVARAVLAVAIPKP